MFCLSGRAQSAVKVWSHLPKSRTRTVRCFTLQQKIPVPNPTFPSCHGIVTRRRRTQESKWHDLVPQNHEEIRTPAISQLRPRYHRACADPWHLRGRCQRWVIQIVARGLLLGSPTLRSRLGCLTREVQLWNTKFGMSEGIARVPKITRMNR